MRIIGESLYRLEVDAESVIAAEMASRVIPHQVLLWFTLSECIRISKLAHILATIKELVNKSTILVKIHENRVVS